jgi:tetratricopeptide (TPR) repeat protein
MSKRRLRLRVRIVQSVCLVCLACVVSAALVGCGGPTVYARPTRWLPPAQTQSSSLMLGQPQPEAVPASAEDALTAWLGGDVQGAFAFFDRPEAAQSALGLMGRGQAALQRGLYTYAAKSFSALLLSHPDSALAPTAASLLWQLRTFPGQFEAIASVAVDGFVWAQASAPTRLFMQRLGGLIAAYQARVVGAPTPDLTPWGRPNQWQWVGPVSPFDLADAFAPTIVDADPTLAESYDTYHHKLQRQSNDFADVIEPGAASSGVYVLESFIHVDADADAVLVLRSGSGAQLWLDSSPAITRDVLHGYPPIEQARRVRLTQGDHRLRVHLSAGASQASFEVLVLPADGRAPMGWLKRAAPTATWAAHALGDPLDWVTDTASASSEDPWALWQAATLARELGDFDKGAALIERLEALAPSFSPLHIVAAEIARSDSTLDPTAGLEVALSRYRALLNLDPLAGHAHMLLGFLLFHEERYDESLAAFDALIARIPDEFLPHYYRYKLLEAIDLQELAGRALRVAASLRPASCNLAAAIIEADANTYAFPVPSEIPAESLYCPEVQQLLARLYYIPRGDADAAVETFSRLAELSPQDTSRWLDLARAYVAAGEHDAALSALERGASFQPDPDAALITERADLLITLDRLPDARALTTRALTIAPADLSLHAIARTLGNPPALDALRIDGLKFVQSYLEDERSYSDLAGFYLLDYGAFRYYPDGSHLYVTHQISQVLTKEGIELLGEVRLPDDAVITRLRTIKSDGQTVVEPEAIPNKNSISMPNLEVGDFVEVEYLTANPSAPQSQGFFTVPRWYFQITDAPLMHSEIIIEVPKDLEPLIDMRASVPPPTITEQGAFRRYRYLMTEMLPPRHEPFEPPGLDLIPSIEISYGPRIADIHRQYENALLSVTRPSPSLQPLLDEARALAPTGDRRALVRALNDLIHERVRTSNEGVFSTQAAWIWSRRAGNYFTLLKTLLDMAQIPAQLVLVKPFGASEHVSPIPNLDDYRQLLLRVDVGEAKPLWLFFNGDFSPFDLIPLTLQGRPAIALDAAAATLTTDMYDPEVERQRVTFDIAITDEGHISATGAEVSQGFRGAGLRGLIKQLQEDPSKVDKVLEGFLGAFFRSVSIRDHAFENTSRSDLPVTVRYDFDAKHFGVVLPDRTLEVKALIYHEDLSRDYAKLSERKQPLILPNTHNTDITFRFVLPPGSKLTSAPKAVDLQTPFGSFTRAFEPHPSDPLRFTLHERLDLSPQIIPASEYPAFVDFLARVDLAQAIQFSAALPPAKKPTR